MPKLSLVVAPLAALACASCVTDTKNDESEVITNLSTERACFYVRQVNGYSRAPDGQRGDRIYVSTGVRDRFLLETWGVCPELDFSMQVGIDPGFPGAICTGDTVDILIPANFGARADVCRARVLGKMVDDEEPQD